MWQLSEQAHARSEQGSERTVCINAFRGAFYRAVQCCAVRCSEVHWPCLQLLRAGSCNLCCCRLLSRAWLSGERPRLKESGRGGCCSVEESIGSSPGALSRLAPLPADRKRLEFINRILVRDLGIHSLPQKSRGLDFARPPVSFRFIFTLLLTELNDRSRRELSRALRATS